MGNPSNAQPTGDGSTTSSSEPQTSSVRRRSSTGSPSVFMASVSRAMSRVASRISMSQSNDQTSTVSGWRSSVATRLSSEAQTTSVHVEDVRSPVSEEEVRRTLRGTWPITGSSFFACLSCLLGLYNISRFAMMVFLYKGPFLFQFLILSIVLGIPFLFLMVALGQFLGSGMLDMWYISPAFKGVGVALLYAYAIIGVYSAVPISWMFIYFKDSFITAREPYKWATCSPKFASEACVVSLNQSKPDHVGWTVPSYFYGQVLEHRPQDEKIGEVKFELAFNLTIVWFIVFLTLSRGIRSYGKTVFAMNIFPISLLLIISIRFLEQWGRGVAFIFAVPWRPILSDPWSWVLAAREVFFTWVIFGGVVLQHSSHNKSGAQITRVVVCLAILTLICLFLASMLIACSIHALFLRGLTFSPTSYEGGASAIKVLTTVNKWPVPAYDISPVSLFVGECLVPTGSKESTSGYQSLRLATEVFPALLAMEGARRVSSFWAISFYGMLIMFGIGQQVSVWGCVVESIVSLNYKKLPKWQTILAFVLCTVGLLLGLPFTTNLGMSLIYFFDFCIGSLWWIAGIYLIMLIAVLLIRGRPYGTDQLVGIVTKRPTVRVWLLPVLIFEWNVLLPAVFLVFSISFVRTGQEGSTHSWFGMAEAYQPWPLWVKQMAFTVQTVPLLSVFFICAYQAIRYLIPLNDVSVYQKIQSLCCPVFPPSVIASNQRQEQSNNGQNGSGIVNAAFEDDPPPKYTPPPSYSSATAKKIASKILRHSSFPNVESSPPETERRVHQQMPLQTTSPNVFVLPPYDSEQDQSEDGTQFYDLSCPERDEGNREALPDVISESNFDDSSNASSLLRQHSTQLDKSDDKSDNAGCTSYERQCEIPVEAGCGIASSSHEFDHDKIESRNPCTDSDVEMQTSKGGQPVLDSTSNEIPKTEQCVLHISDQIVHDESDMVEDNRHCGERQCEVIQKLQDTSSAENSNEQPPSC